MRLIALAVLLLSCLAGHGLQRAAGRPSRWPRRFLGAAGWIVGARVRVQGEIATPPLLLLANHVSWIDILVLAGASGTAFVAHSGLGDHPVLHWLCSLNRTVFIARHDRGSVSGQTGQLRDALIRGETLTLFPEGTTGDGIEMLPFKSSLLAAVDPPLPGLAVQPVLIDYGVPAPQIAWSGNEPGLANVLRVLARPGTLDVRLHFLPVLSDEERSSRKTAAAAARSRMFTAMAQARV